jgi:hypothetical protein
VVDCAAQPQYNNVQHSLIMTVRCAMWHSLHIRVCSTATAPPPDTQHVGMILLPEVGPARAAS